MSARTITAIALVSTLAFAGESMAFDAITPQAGGVGNSHTLDCGDVPAKPLFENASDSSMTVNVRFESECPTGGYVEQVNENGRGGVILDMWEAGSKSVLTTVRPGQEIWAGCGNSADTEGCCTVDISFLTPID